MREYHRYASTVTRTTAELTTMIRRTVGWLRLANVLFALATVVLAALLMVIVRKVSLSLHCVEILHSGMLVFVV